MIGGAVDAHQKRFPGGRYRITQAENDALCAALGSTPSPEGRAHPIFYYIATQVAMGLTVEQLCARCEFDVADGPMITQSDAWFDGDLAVDCEYQVAGEIRELVRRPSRTFGAVDVLTYELQLLDGEGAIAATCTNQWVLPRREAGAS